MKLNIQLSGIARDLYKKDFLNIEITNPESLHKSISESIPGLQEYYFLVAVNGKKTENYSSIKTGDKIVVFSPVAGG